MIADLYKLGELALKMGIIKREDIEELKTFALSALGGKADSDTPASLVPSEAAERIATLESERNAATAQLRQLTERAESAEEIVEQYRNYVCASIPLAREIEQRIAGHLLCYHQKP